VYPQGMLDTTRSRARSGLYVGVVKQQDVPSPPYSFALERCSSMSNEDLLRLRRPDVYVGATRASIHQNGSG